MKNNIIIYSYTNPLYYEALDYLGDSDLIKKILKKLKIPDAIVVEKGIFIFVKTQEQKAENEAGWKIHISVVPENYIEILEIVLPVLFKERIPFKVVRNIETYILMSQKPFPRESYGKFITIYPPDSKSFLRLLDKLNKLLENYNGPRILSDRRYKQCHVLYYRYGGICPKIAYDNQGYAHTYIKNGNDEYVEDIRRPFYSLPEKIKDIIPTKPEAGSSKLLKYYEVLSAIRFSNGGGTYLVLNRKTRQKKIAKEARPNTALTIAGEDAITIRQNEATVLYELSNISFVPDLEDFFFDSEHFFLIEEYIEGISLYEYVMYNNPILSFGSQKEIKEYLLEVLRLFLQLCHFLQAVHAHGYVMQDLTADNILIDKDGCIKVIDLEGCQRKGRTIRIGKNTNISSNNYRNDIYELGMLFFACLLPKGEICGIKNNAVAEYIEDISSMYGIPKYFSRFVLHWLSDNVPVDDIQLIDQIKTLIHLLENDFSQWNRKIQSVESIKQNISFVLPKIVNGIIASRGASRGFEFPVFPEICNEYNVSNGLAGIVRGLFLLGNTQPLLNLKSLLSKIPSSVPLGLYTGLGGCIWTLVDAGDYSMATDLFRENFYMQKGDDKSLYSGSCGCGLVALKLFCHTKDYEFLDYAIKIGEQLITQKNTCNHNNCIGYAKGDSGAALFLLYLSIITNNEEYAAYGKTLLDKEITFAVYREKNGLIDFPYSVNSNIASPYFMEGTSGVLAVLLRYGAYFNDKNYRDISTKLADSLHIKYSVSCSLFYGTSGIGNTLLDCYHFLGDTKYMKMALTIAHGCLLSKIIYKNETFLFSDLYNRKLCSDYGYGATGISLFLNRVRVNDKNNFNFFLDEFCRRDI